jgi:ribosomal protein S18 acetylase RimI-like enzyme
VTDAVGYVSVLGESLTGELAESAAGLLQRAVTAGAALGWVDPPSSADVSSLLRDVAAESVDGDAALLFAMAGAELVGLGYWRRYRRPTHRPHADLEKLAVDAPAQSGGVGRGLMGALIGAARAAQVEVLTLDLRADNARAIALYESLGFRRYGVLPRFVAVGERRYDKVFYALDLR